jgi:hypothetical protein
MRALLEAQAGMVAGPLAPTVYSVKRRLSCQTGRVEPSGL